MKSMTRVLALSVCALGAVALAGCAGGASGPSDTELIGSLIADTNAALLAQDIEKATMSYTDDFEWDQGGKEEYVEFLNTAKDGGFLEDMEVDMADMVVTVDGDAGTAGPVLVMGAFGELVFDFDLEKRDGQWMVTGQSQQ